MLTENQIGQRIKRYRLNQNLSQKKLAEMCALSIKAIENAEQGKSVLSTYIAIMGALGRGDVFDLAFPEENISPVQLVERKNKERKRAYRRRSHEKESSDELEDW